MQFHLPICILRTKHLIFVFLLNNVNIYYAPSNTECMGEISDQTIKFIFEKIEINEITIN